MDFDDHIIDIELDIPSILVCKHAVHQALVSCPYVLQIERHFTVAQGSMISLKGCFLHIFITLGYWKVSYLVYLLKSLQKWFVS